MDIDPYGKTDPMQEDTYLTTVDSLNASERKRADARRKERAATRCVATAYYPDNIPMEGGNNDRRGAPLHTLQAYVRKARDGTLKESDYVSVSMDSNTLPYGTPVVIPAIEKKYGIPIRFLAVDTGGRFEGTDGRRIDICMANESSADAFGTRSLKWYRGRRTG